MNLYAPKEFSVMASSLIGTPYLENAEWSPHPDDPTRGFDCWGLCRYLYRWLGIDMPEDPFIAHGLFDFVKQPEFACIISFRTFSRTERIHLGFMETHRIVLHCSQPTFGVARDYIDIFVAPYVLHKLRT